MTRPTPWPAGPYSATINEHTNTHNVRGPDGELLAIVGTMRRTADPQMRALAILLAHAPELIECLERLTQYVRLETPWNGKMVFQCPCCGEQGDDKHAPDCDFLLASLAVSRVRAITAEVVEAPA